ncbi:hypothetical protein AYO21_05058 [Fonsecaea monophora]|uniref:Uncharacterized protein n=1 Tax=Fonsecaea monophora TaxID=254056 RepID=A0A177FAU7_9EURO|nr:hypothetical protein AYO21_05058 [Fonsecaea monophora]OAG40760.1 hypothetical protein AYO21_05058 [Fonsecaea monophora]
MDSHYDFDSSGDIEDLVRRLSKAANHYETVHNDKEQSEEDVQRQLHYISRDIAWLARDLSKHFPHIQALELLHRDCWHAFLGEFDGHKGVHPDTHKNYDVSLIYGRHRED